MKLALVISLLFPLAALAQAPKVSELLPPTADYERNQDCTEVTPASIFFSGGKVSLDPQPSTRPPKALREPFAQGEADICFAYASAELISQRTGIVVSPLDIDATYFFAPIDGASRNLKIKGFNDADNFAAKIRDDRQTNDIAQPEGQPAIGFVDSIAGGDEGSALLMSNAKGLCPAKDLPSNEGFRHHASLLRRLKDAHPSGRIARDGAYAMDQDAAGVNAAWVRYVDHVCHRVPSPVPILPIQYLAAKDLNSWRQLSPEAREAAHQPLFSRLDYALDHDRPLIIGIDWYIFEKPDGSDGDHAITVIARKKINGVCHYLLRDSIDEPCKNMYKKFQPRCTRGHIWVSEPELADTMYSATYLR